MNMAMKKQFIQTYANNYVETAVSEATPHKLVEMLYEGAIKNMSLAKVFIQQKNMAKKSEHINKAMAIVNSLRAGLNLEKGAEVGNNLYALYDYTYRRLFEASSKNDIEVLDELIEHMKTLLEAWQQMPEHLKRMDRTQIERLGVAS
ncbi:MAG: flagellar export chaperone FliS [Gammaproteobacteria bacterium]|uniref:flagellar export chaperone FliS n=1 Tax=Thiomicrorhabdus cannonii TaxID=2748011 RepID=UPI0015BB8D6F|nr:flagellar export chaperone FliS [Thiomicrorhabdus cannonii]MBD3768164.1 flagellar export chaperone FliS [Gammaproteobacteria bacterium]